MEWYEIGLIILAIFLTIYNGWLTFRISELWTVNDKLLKEREKQIDHIDVEVSVEDEEIEGICSVYSQGELLYELKDYAYFNYISETTIKHLTTEQLEQELADRKLKDKYPLAHEIKHIDCEFVELYIDGQLYKKCTREYAWQYVKSYGKDKDITYKEVR